MTKLILTIALVFTTFSAHAGLPAPKDPAADTALKAAQDYVYATAFANITDDDGHISVVPAGSDDTQYLFTATYKEDGIPDCVVTIQVNKETGKASQDNVDACQKL